MKTRRPAFTLFEVILAIALSAVLLTLVGTAINLYLVRVTADRSQVEEAQLARSVLAMITDDIRATTIYQAQDTSAIAQLMAAGTPFDVDSIDQAKLDSAGGTGGATGGSSTGGSGGTGGSSTGTGTGASSGAAGGQSATGAEGTSEESEDTLPLGLNGTVNELYVDVTRLPRREELFSTVTGYTNAPSPAAGGAAGSATAMSASPRPASDLKSVHYYVRPGEVVQPGSAAATAVSPDAQARIGGLVHQEIPRQMRLLAEQTGNSGILDAGAALVAPEVVDIQFRYYDGSEVLDDWDMTDKKALPIAIEVSIRINSPSTADSSIESRYDSANIASSARSYRQTVYLPMSQLADPTAQSADTESTDTTGTDSASSTGSSSTGTGSLQP